MESGGSVDAGSLWCCVPVSFGRSNCQKDTPDFILNDPLVSSLQTIFFQFCMCLPNTTLAFDSVSVAPPSIFCWMALQHHLQKGPLNSSPVHFDTNRINRSAEAQEAPVKIGAAWPLVTSPSGFDDVMGFWWPDGMHVAKFGPDPSWRIAWAGLHLLEVTPSCRFGGWKLKSQSTEQKMINLWNV